MEVYITSNLAKLYHLIGERRHTEITKKLINTEMTDQNLWDEIITFLDEELKVKESVLLFKKTNPIKNEDGVRKNEQKDHKFKSYNMSSSKLSCVICEKKNHVTTNQEGKTH